MYHSVTELKLGKTSKCLILDLLFPVGLFLQNLQELNYLGAVLFMSYLAETGKRQKNIT